MTRTKMVDRFHQGIEKRLKKNYKYMCSYIYNNNYPFIKGKDRLSLYKKTSIIIIIIWSPSIRKMIDLSLYKRHGVLWYKVYHKEKKW